MVLMNEIEYELNYGFHALGFATKTAINAIAAAAPNRYVEIGTYMSGWSSELVLALNSSLNAGNGDKGDYMGNLATMNKVVGSDDMSTLGSITFFDGRTDGKLKENEILLSYYYKDLLIPSSMKITLSEAQKRLGMAPATFFRKCKENGISKVKA